ncbi:transcriptional regulator [Azorhizobium doebereinerae]|uniref:transcriptional regulator n=1 Tax=Azorhizobium doebereinerae TaxID=281091 RepID=UPI0003FB9FD3|nr:transcriptional regulator [Azorhizobium doebereinerae]
MTGDEIKEARQRLGLSTAQLGIALGLGGKTANISKMIRRIESGDGFLTPAQSRLLVMFIRFGVPADMLDEDPNAAGRAHHVAPAD